MQVCSIIVEEYSMITEQVRNTNWRFEFELTKRDMSFKISHKFSFDTTIPRIKIHSKENFRSLCEIKNKY